MHSQIAPIELDTTKLHLTNGNLFKVIDDNIPNDILNFLDSKFNLYTTNLLPSKTFNDDPSVVANPLMNKKYLQWDLQESPDFSKWKDNDFERISIYMSTFVEEVREFKFSYTTPKTNVNWHVLHSRPRIHIPLSDVPCLFDVVDTKQKMYTYELVRGKLYLLNVCYPHRVRNISKEVRKQAFFTVYNIKPHI